MEENDQSHLYCSNCGRVAQGVSFANNVTFANLKMEGQVIDVNGMCLSYRRKGQRQLHRKEAQEGQSQNRRAPTHAQDLNGWRHCPRSCHQSHQLRQQPELLRQGEKHRSLRRCCLLHDFEVHEGTILCYFSNLTCLSTSAK